MSIQISAEIQNFWKSFCNYKSSSEYLRDFKFEPWSFGNDKVTADKLGRLVLEGRKTATCSLLKAYRGYENEIPRVGLYSIICDGNENPLCVVLLKHTWICKFKDVTERHAYEEGEGDRSLNYWRESHLKYFKKFDDDFNEEDYLICEKFVVVFKE